MKKPAKVIGQAEIQGLLDKYTRLNRATDRMRRRLIAGATVEPGRLMARDGDNDDLLSSDELVCHGFSMDGLKVDLTPVFAPEVLAKSQAGYETKRCEWRDNQGLQLR